MAKIKLNPVLNEAFGAHGKAVFQGLGLTGTSAMFTRNQNSLILADRKKKDRTKSKRKPKHADRFAQLECMWKLLTRGQRKAFHRFAEKHNYFSTKRLRDRDAFFKLGLQYRLNEFLTEELNTKIKIELRDIDEKSIKLNVYTTGEIKYWDELVRIRLKTL